MFDLTDFQSQLLQAALYVLASVVVGVILHFVIQLGLKRGNLLKDITEVKTVTQKLSAPLRWLLILVCVYVVLPQIDFFEETVQHILQLLIIANSIWLIIRSIRVTRLVVMSRYDLSQEDNLQARKVYTQFHMIENILVFITIVLGVGIMLMTFEGIRQIGISLLTSAGIAGIILGFAAQKLIATILAGMQIAITQPIRIDDVVIVEGEWGWIEEITLTFVVVKIWDQRRMVLPTTYFIETPFQNWTRTTSQIMGTVFIETDFFVPFEAIRQEVTRVLESTPLWDKRVNVVQVTEAKAQTVEMRVLVSAADSPKAWDLRVLVREKLVEFIRDNYPESLPRTRVEMKDEQNGKQNQALG